jgi:hypothetical protein
LTRTNKQLNPGAGHPFSGEIVLHISGALQRPTNSGDNMQMQIVSMQHIPLTSAYLCPDCDCVGNSSRQCPACACEVLIALAGVLNRGVEPQAQTKFDRISALAA